MSVDAGLGSVGSWLLGGVAVTLAVALLVTAFVVITYAARGTPVRRVRAIDDRLAADRAEELDGAALDVSSLTPGSDEFRETARALSSTVLSDGHRVRQFFTGDALYDALLADVSRAELLVTWHVFWFKPGTAADRVAQVLAERARAGVPVLLLLDYFGSKGIGDDYVRRLRDAGVEVAVFRPPRWNTLYKAQHRMHIRSVVIDGLVGYTGGFGVDDRWLGDGRHAGRWRDTSVRVEGESVDQLQGAFVSNWAEATGDLLLGNSVFDFGLRGRHDGPHTAGLMYSAPSLGSTSAERFFFIAIAAAHSRLWMSTAYFTPDRHFRELLCRAAGRGVDVRILTPGGNTDRPSTWHAARAHYEELLTAGVRIFEYRPTMMHAKTLVVDGVWAMVGTLNFDNRSMVLNDEVALLTLDRALGTALEEAFVADLEWADEMTPALERARTSVGDRVRQWAAGRVSRLL